MELFLLLMTAGLAAGAGLWAAFSKKDKDEKPPFFNLEQGEGPKSSPGLPSGAGGPEGERGKPVVLGDEGAKSAADQLRDAMRGAPQPQVVPGQEGGEEAPAPRPGRRAKKSPLKVSHDTDDIIPRSSKFAHHRRALNNAEALMERGKGEEAKEIFERIKNRIPDEEIRKKLEQNIEDIERWQNGLELDEPDEEGIRFPEIIVPLTTQTVALENLTEGLKKVSESLVDQLNQAVQLNQLQAQAPPMQMPPMPGQPPPQAQMPAPGPAGPPVTIPGPVTATGPITTPAGAGQPQVVNINIDASLPDLGESIKPPGKKPDGFDEDLPEGITIDDSGEVMTEGWTDEDFAREWEKFKDLPIADRRDVSERRVLQERRGPDSKRKDRRAGEDRRKNDLFEERDEFLDKLEEHKQNKKDLAEHHKKELEKKFEEEPEPKVQIRLVEPPPEPAYEAPPPPPPPPEPEEPEGELPPSIEEPVAELPTPAEEPPGPEIPPAQEPEELVLPNAREGLISPEPELKLEPEPRTEELEKPPEDVIVEDKVEEEPEPEPEEPTLMQLMPEAPFDSIDLPEAMDDGYAPPQPDMEDEPGAGAEPAPMDAAASAGAGEGVEEFMEIPELGDDGDDLEAAPEDKPPVQEIHGVLELKPPDEDDAPFLTLTYDFSKIPDSFQLSGDFNTMEYIYYKYKPMLVKAQEFTRRKMLKNALNYYRVIKSQNLPPEFKRMINRNIQDITEYLEKFLMTRGG